MKATRAFLCALLGLAACSQPTEEDSLEQPGAVRFLNDGGEGGYARVLESRAFRYPEDHGSHDAYRTEWWYFTGNLDDRNARHFGFELTFFRFALDPAQRGRTSGWGTNQAWMAHLAVTDTQGERFIAAERFSRGALGLAGHEPDPFRVWVEDWSASGSGRGIDPLFLRAGTDRLSLELTLSGGKPPVAHGEGGMDRKGPEHGNASHYYSLTRVPASGTLRIDGATFDVSGSAWMDREWGTSALGPELAGWDWFGLQLTDGREIMYYRLRSHAGGSSPFSGGSLVLEDGTRIALGADDVVLTPLRRWRSPQTGATYPVSWQLHLPGEDMTLTVEPFLDQQELNLTVRYWEGAVRVTGTARGRSLTGSGYAELVGY